MKKSITFFFPYYDVSGVPILFLNLAEFISAHYNYDVYIVDYKNGYMSCNRKKESKVKLIEFENGKFVRILDTILVMQAILPYAIRPELLISKNTKLFFWCLYPDIFFPFVFPFNLFSKTIKNNIKFYQLILNFFYKNTLTNVKNFVTDLNDCNALIFMDSSNLNRTNEILELELTPNIYLPILCNGDENNVKKRFSLNNDLNISWVGRLCDFKINILVHTIEKVSILANKLQKNIIFHIIGNGDKRDLIDNISVNNEFFNLKIVGEIEKDKLDQYLIDNIDISTAMGTSALESAKLAIPTIVLDISHKKIEGDYIFRWLHDTINFDVAHNVSKLDFQDNNKSLEKILINFNKEKELLKQKSYDYFWQNHSVESVSNKFIKLIELYSIKFEDINNTYFKKSFIRKLYEFKKYKIWSK